jgi:hypothetical protein
MSAGVNSERKQRSGYVSGGRLGMKDKINGGISENRVGCEDSSKPPDEADFPDARHEDMTNCIEAGDNDTAIEEDR